MEQYFIYLANMARGDFGISFTQQNREVNDIIAEHFRISAALGILAIAFAALGGILWGALTALYRNRLPDIVIMLLVILGISVPGFVFAGLGQLGVVNLNAALGFTLFPVGGWGTVSHMIVPALVLGLGTMAFLTRLMRSSMLEIANADFLRTARAKGLPANRIFRKPSVAQRDLAGGDGAGAVPSPPSPPAASWWSWCFAIPGLGRYFVQAVQQSDYTVIMGTTVFYGAFLVFMVIVVDIIYGFVDPRVRLE